LKTYFK